MTIPEKAVEAFKAAWHAADDEGRAGERVRAGLAAAAPYIAAQALRDAADEVRGYAYTPDDVREVAHGDDYADGITDAHHVFDRLLAAPRRPDRGREMTSYTEYEVRREYADDTHSVVKGNLRDERLARGWRETAQDGTPSVPVVIYQREVTVTPGEWVAL